MGRNSKATPLGSNINPKKKFASDHPGKRSNKSNNSRSHTKSTKRSNSSSNSASPNTIIRGKTNKKTNKLKNTSEMQPKTGKKARNKKNKMSKNESQSSLADKPKITSHSKNDTTDDDIIDISSASEDDDYDVVLVSSDNQSDEELGEETEAVENKDKDEVIQNQIANDSDESPVAKKQKTMAGNSLTDNSDFIAFDFSSDEEEKKTKYEYDNFDEESSDSESDDNEYLSNDESGYHTKSTTHKTGESNSKYPWIRNNDHSRQIEISDWLTMEIKDFINYISPSAEEIQARNGLVKKLRQSITSLWPDAELYCFGSFATDLYLPGSDIDMVIVSKRRNGKYDNKSSLYQLSSFLRTRGLGVNIEPIAKAKVPIIKFVDPTTGIHIDISFERVNGIKAAELIVSWINETPGLRELVMIVKQFLSVRKLNVVHTGGLGGFAIICLVRSFLKLHPRVVTGSIDPLANLGVLLIEFFELYGYNFGYDSTAIAFNDKGDAMYVTKHSNPALQGRNPFLLAIQDPHDPSNNISRGTHNLRDIKRAFGGAFELLANKCYDMYNASYKERLGQSILGDIIKYKGKQRDFEDARETVTNHAYLAASSGSSKSGTLPPLPSEGKRGKLHEDFQFYSDLSDSEDELSKLQAVYEKSQESSSKATKERSIKVDQLMGIQDNEDADDSYDPTQLTKTAVQDFSDSDDDDTKSQAKKNGPKVDERNKRDYWLMKGSSF